MEAEITETLRVPKRKSSRKVKGDEIIDVKELENEDEFSVNGIPVVTTYETTPVITAAPLDTLVTSFEERYKEQNKYLQKLEEKATKAEEALAREEKARKEVEELNAKLLAEKTALLDSLSGEKGALQEFQEKTAKLQAQKADIDNQLRVSISHFMKHYYQMLLLITSCWNGASL